MTPGSLLIRNETKPWSKASVDGYLIVVSIGLLAGVAVAMGRMPLQLPGHKALFWIPPILATRWLTRRPLGATVGSLATVLTTLSLGGRLAGDWTAAPLVFLAGGMMDAIVPLAEHRRGVLRLVSLFATAGVSANLICFIKRLFEPSGTFWSTSNLRDIAWVAESHALFGLLAGLLAAFVCAVVQPGKGKRSAVVRSE